MKLVDAGTVDIPHLPLSHNVNQTSTGYYREVNGQTENLRVPAAWYQDDVSKRIHLDCGEPRKPTWQFTIYYFPDKSYRVFPQNGKVTCTLLSDLTYDILNDNYGPKYLGYVGRHTLQEFGDNQVADLHAGPAVDADGSMGTLFYAHPANHAYMGLIRMGQPNISFYEYWFDKNSPTVPDSSVFDLPSECDHPEAGQIGDTWSRWNENDLIALN